MDMGPEPEPNELRLEHFKCNYDQTWDYPAIANSLFDGEKVMVQDEKRTGNHHVHFQGYTTLAKRTYDGRITDLSATHYIKKMEPGRRPIRRMRSGKATEMGFQYILKEGRQPLYQRGFSEDEIKDLIEKSKEYVDKLKSSAADILRDHPKSDLIFKFPNAETMEKRVRFLVGESYRKAGRKVTGRYFKDEILNALINDPRCSNPQREELYMRF